MTLGSSDAGPCVRGSVGTTESLKHQRLLRAYKPYTLFEQAVCCCECLRLQQRYAREVGAVQPVVR